MATLAERIAEAEASLDNLKREAAQAGAAGCVMLGHDWKHCGGSNCGCGQCSVPVHKCSRCGDYDYGDNAEANEQRRACAEEPNNV